MAASWSGPQAGPTEYKVAARDRAHERAPLGSFGYSTSGSAGWLAARHAAPIVIRRVTSCDNNEGKPTTMKPGPKPLLDTPMTHAERQARYRANHAQGRSKLRHRNPTDRRSRPQRWHDGMAELLELLLSSQTWLKTFAGT
jgi:hypothetical protein